MNELRLIYAKSDQPEELDKVLDLLKGFFGAAVRSCTITEEVDYNYSEDYPDDDDSDDDDYDYRGETTSLHAILMVQKPDRISSSTWQECLETSKTFIPKVVYFDYQIDYYKTGPRIRP